ncbi:hypothetical protein [Wolbachia endosymbiont of Litomosoides sigmodontis]|nr:hypothetical protein [Wolbachia endosymbiont of Litomosoides sigmodontis]
MSNSAATSIANEEFAVIDKDNEEFILVVRLILYAPRLISVNDF